jgi:uncharacterized protein (TIGR02145 family)
MDAVRLVVVALPATDISHEGFTANWTKNNVATGYLLDVATDSDFENIIINALAAGNVTSRIVTGLDPGTDYYYRVTALDGPRAGHYSNVIEATTETVGLGYGLLYNWYAATDPREITSAGWHVPDIAEFQILANYLGAAGDYGNNAIGGKLREIGLIYWLAPNTGATNEVNYNGRGASYRHLSGSFGPLKDLLMLWTTYIPFPNTGCIAQLSSVNNKFVCASTIGQIRTFGYSIRLVKDTTTLTHGQTGTYVGNDGKVYRTICIGTQEWLADNLAETKFRNGDDIPNVTDNDEWAALVTGAMCAYDNDWNNV